MMFRRLNRYNIKRNYLKLKDKILLLSNRKLWNVNKRIDQLKISSNDISYRRGMSRKSGLSDNEFTYGETLYQTMRKIAKELCLKKGDMFVDLGCGPGKLCFYLNLVHGINCEGVELNPAFYKIAKDVKEEFNVDGVSFFEKNILDHDLAKADAAFLCSTCFSDKTMKKLHDKLSGYSGLKIVSVTKPIEGEAIETVKKLILPFSWTSGSDVYIQKVR